MKIKILQNTVCGGKDVKKGATVEARDRDARILIGFGKAELIEAEADKDGGKAELIEAEADKDGGKKDNK